MEEKGKVRIKDIARLAGVSVGTVDRVLHNRGEVSEENRVKILDIAKSLDFKPNQLARTLALKKAYTFVTLLPEYRLGDNYWEAPHKGIERAAQEIRDYNTRVQSFYFDQFDAESFRREASRAMESKPDAILFAPMFKREAEALIERCKLQSVPYAFIDSLLPDSRAISYVGQDAERSGRLAARLLSISIQDGDQVLVARISRKRELSSHLLQREKGFLSFFSANPAYDQCRFIHAEVTDTGDDSYMQELDGVFDSNAGITGIFVLNSKSHLVARFLEKRGLPGTRLVGYDLLGLNVGYLKTGLIDFLIAQRPEEQGYMALMQIFNNRVLNREVNPVVYAPIDIITKENIDYYMNFNV